MSIGSQQEIGAARRVSQKQLQICSQEDSAAEEEARTQRRNNRGATYISATHEGGQRGLSHAKQQEAMNGTNTKPSSQGTLVRIIKCIVCVVVVVFFLTTTKKEQVSYELIEGLVCLCERRLF